MRLVRGFPPNYQQILKAGLRPPPSAAFTWGEELYIPGGGEPDPPLKLHEQTHMRQQAAAGGPQTWWDRYLRERDFRLKQELEAYRAQYGLASRLLGRPERRELQRAIARALSSAMYGGLLSQKAALAALA